VNLREGGEEKGKLNFRLGELTARPLGKRRKKRKGTPPRKEKRIVETVDKPKEIRVLLVHEVYLVTNRRGESDFATRGKEVRVKQRERLKR